MTKYKIAFSYLTLKEKIASGSKLWGTFNSSFENLELEVLDIANLIYTGHAYTTWHQNQWRHGDNYVLGQHIALDFDTEDERSTLAFLMQDRFITKYAALAYTTPTHTPDKPRARVVFLLDTPIHQPNNYTLAVMSLLWLFGAADPKAKDAVRFFYGSVDCDIEFVNQVLPLSTVKDIIARYQATGVQEKKEQEYKPTNYKDVAYSTVQTCIQMAREGGRNNLGFWLACRLAENGIPKTQAEDYMRMYHSQLNHLGRTEYTYHEAMASLHSAYRKIR